jgi:hypothetical protein
MSLSLLLSTVFTPSAFIPISYGTLSTYSLTKESLTLNTHQQRVHHSELIQGIILERMYPIHFYLMWYIPCILIRFWPPKKSFVFRKCYSGWFWVLPDALNFYIWVKLLFAGMFKLTMYTI